MSERQKKIYEYIKDYINKNRYSPSIREINKAVGLNSISTVHDHLKKMREKGYINFIDSFPRTISIVEEK